MSIKIQGCTVNDATALARNNMSAFWPDSTWRLSFKDRALEDVITECTKRIPTTLLTDRITKRHQKVVDIHAETVMGYARWIMPDRVTSQWLEAQTPAVTVSEEKEYETLFSSANWIRPTDITGLGAPLESIMNRLMSGKEYIELEYLAVHPDHRRQGVATLLVESGMTVADRLGVDIIVMAYKSAVGIYKRLGFETLEHLIQDDSKFGGEGEFGVYFMLRKSHRAIP